MTRRRIARDTLALFAMALCLGACSAPDSCGRVCCEGASPASAVPMPVPPVVAPVPAPVPPPATAPVAPPAAAHAGDANASPADQAAAKAVHNYKRLSPRIARGAAPEGDAAFAALAAAGITSIVTVDGAAPDVETAKKHGLRYVHIPFGYDGIPASTALELSKTFEQLAPAGPIFVHCHHGKHRGPAGCEIARIVLDGVSNEEALADMTAAGTDPKYAGLFDSIRTFRKPTPEALAGVTADMPEIATPTSRAAAMALIDKSWDRMKLVRTATWNVPKDHADVDPAHEAVILAEGLREFGRRADIASGEGAEFHKLLGEAEAAAWDLSKALEKGALDAGRAESAFTATQNACATCHKAYRDNTHR